jgi:hypothetical protein
MNIVIIYDENKNPLFVQLPPSSCSGPNILITLSSYTTNYVLPPEQSYVKYGPQTAGDY